MAMSEIQGRERKKKKKNEGEMEREKRLDLDKGKRQEGLIRETELLPERDNERATEDEIKERRGPTGSWEEMGNER